ncbi:DUF2089 family protein [Sphingobacterium kyonggiense]|uniref:DUF2089 family protein n=2 Tax=Sphingobacteriaceae TaxID=84566 RepID=A0ABP7YYE5_9SPHI
MMFKFIKKYIYKMKFPLHCPACNQEMTVVKLHCESCQTEVTGRFALPLFMQLDADEQDFILQFLLDSGSLKEMANKMGKSYPTVRNKLDELIEKVKSLQV